MPRIVYSITDEEIKRLVEQIAKGRKIDDTMLLEVAKVVVARLEDVPFKTVQEVLSKAT